MDWLDILIAVWWTGAVARYCGWYFALRRYSRLLDERKRLLDEEERRIKKFRTLTIDEVKSALREKHYQEYPTAKELN